MYRPLYDEKHRAITISTDPHVKNKFLQKGVREKLLCNACEQKIGIWEKYTDRFLFKEAPPVERWDDAVVARNVDYQKVKLFQLSLLWRASISSLEHFSDVVLGPHEEKIREMIFEQNPGKPHEYCCMITYPEIFKSRSDLIIAPEMIRVDRFRTYRFCLNGLFWVYFVGKHTDQIPPKAYVQADGTFPIISDRGQATEYFERLASDFF